MKPWEQVNRLETQTEKKNGKRGKLHLLHGSQILLPVWTGMIKRRKDWEYSSCIIIHVTVFWGHFESHSLLKCSGTRWAGFVSEHNVVHRSFIKKISVTLLLPMCHHPWGLIREVLARGAAGHQGAFPAATGGWWRSGMLTAPPEQK